MYCCKFVLRFKFMRNHLFISFTLVINSSRIAAYIRRWTRSSLVQVMVCGSLAPIKPLETDCSESEFYQFNSRKFIWKCFLPKWWSFCPGGRLVIPSTVAGFALRMGSANERKHYINIRHLFEWTHTQNDPWILITYDDPWQNKFSQLLPLW